MELQGALETLWIIAALASPSICRIIEGRVSSTTLQASFLIFADDAPGWALITTIGTALITTNDAVVADFEIGFFTLMVVEVLCIAFIDKVFHADLAP